MEKPVPVEVPGPVRYMEIPPDLTTGRQKRDIPEGLTYGEAIELWADDRASLDVLNGQLEAIRTLHDD